MKKMLILLLFFSYQAHAGFLTGAVTGALLSSDNKSHPQSTTIVSDKYDVITCEQYPNNNSCKTDLAFYNQQLKCSCITVQDFALRAGYSKVHKIGIQFNGKVPYIIMEVEK